MMFPVLKVLMLFLSSAVFASSPSAKLVFDTRLQEPLWGFDFYSDQVVLFTTKSGKIGVYEFKPGSSAYYLSGSPKVFSAGQGGLLDLKVFELEGKKWIYITYSALLDDSRESQTRLARFVPNFKDKKIEDFELLFQSLPPVVSSKHFGSRVELSVDKKYIFLSIGERGDRERAQDLNQHYGKILRLNVDGSVPKTNPFYDVAKPVQSGVWTLGHRNPQGMDRIPESDEVLVQEHGPRGGDEINWIQKSKNYGWPEITYGKEYWGPTIGTKIKKGFEQPLYQYTPSIAPSGLLVYSGKKYKTFRHHLFSGALVLRHLNVLSPPGSLLQELRSSQVMPSFKFKETRFFESLSKRIRNVGESPSGRIFISTDQGEFFEFLPATAL